MTLTNDQRAAVDAGRAVTVEIDGTPCVVVRKDVYEAAIEEAWGDDPGLDAYQQYK